MSSLGELASWVETSDDPPAHDGLVAATFVIDADGGLRLASRNSEHVVCAEGRPVLAAGEMFFDGVTVVEVTNQSTGYCPEPSSWSSVEAALERVSAKHPGGYTATFVFRRCTACGQVNVVRDEWFECGVCESPLPERWNFDTAPPDQPPL